MRLHRLKLRDFRGIGEREVCFADQGVTVVEGRNEAGKSSMIEALDVLLSLRDSSKSSAVRSVMPSGRDVGSEVEAEISCGEWHFTYFKRFNKQPATTLTVHRPKPEQLTGRAAHDKVNEILDTTVDRALFDALKLLQSGADPALTDLSAAAALSRALDRAAGGPRGADDFAESVAGEEDSVLLDAVAEEYCRYYTRKQGKPTGQLAEAARRADAAGDRYERLRRSREVLDDDIERLRAAVARRGELQRTDELARADQERVDTEWQAAQAVLSKVGGAAQTVGHRRTALTLAERVVAERTDIRRQREVLSTEAVELDAQAGQVREQTVQAQAEVAALEGELFSARTILDDLRARLNAARQVAKRERLAAEVAELTDVLDKLAGFRAELDTIDAELATHSVDAEVAGAAQALAGRIDVARGRLEAASATLRVETLGAHQVSVDGESVDGAVDVVADADRVIEAPGVVRVTVRRSVDTTALAEELDRLQWSAQTLCDAHGLADLSEAAVRAAARTDLTHERALICERRDSLLKWRTFAEIRDWRDVVRTELEGLLAAEVREHESVEQLAEAEQAQADLVERAHAAAVRRKSEASALGERQESVAARRTRVGAQIDELDTKLAELVFALPDEDAEAAVERSRQELQSARDEQNRFDAEAAELDAEGLELRREQISRDIAHGTAELDAVGHLITELSTKLEMYRGESRLDEFDEAQAEWEDACAGLRRVTRRAEAARLLHETLTRTRLESRAKYADPFTRRLDKLGAIVFGDTVRFDVDDDLNVVSRTVDGVTVPRDALSGGAKEQLGLLSRLACATLVDQADGVPVIIDDALGYSDPDRIVAMASVLTEAARDAQVIVLTCSPHRYADVHNAHVVTV
jgi:hypothetical protein